MKLTELFEGKDGRGLRVSRYFEDDEREAEVRVSVWSEGRERRMHADAAVSLTEDEAGRLGRFLAETSAPERAQTF
jgi:hypothetical protein